MYPRMGVLQLQLLKKTQNGGFQASGPIGMKKASKYGEAIFCWKALKQLNNFYERTIGQK